MIGQPPTPARGHLSWGVGSHRTRRLSPAVSWGRGQGSGGQPCPSASVHTHFRKDPAGLGPQQASEQEVRTSIASQDTAVAAVPQSETSSPASLQLEASDSHPDTRTQPPLRFI